MTSETVPFRDYQRAVTLLAVLMRRSKGLIVLSPDEARQLNYPEPVRLQSAPAANGGRFVALNDFPAGLRAALADRIGDGA